MPETKIATPRLTLGPLQYFWPKERVSDFYRDIAGSPLEVIYLGETVCTKRRELRLADWLALGRELADQGHRVVLSTLTLIEAESELSSLIRIIEKYFPIEANDMSAVHMAARLGRSFVAGPGLNVYNHQALGILQQLGLERLVLPVELGRESLDEMLKGLEHDGRERPEIEVIAWGRLPLAHSARCFTARAWGLSKDNCQFQCLRHPEGLPLATQEGRRMLTLNGVQVQSGDIQDLAPYVADLAAVGVDFLRLYPQPTGMSDVIRRFERALAGESLPALPDTVSGYWRGGPGMVKAGP